MTGLSGLTELSVFVAGAVALAFLAGAILLGLLAAGVVMVLHRVGLLRSQEATVEAEKRLSKIEWELADARQGVLNIGLKLRSKGEQEQEIPEHDGPRLPKGYDPEIIDTLEGVGGGDPPPETFDAVRR